AAVPAADALRSLHEERAALGARRLLQGLVVHGEVALGVTVAAVEQSEPRALLHDLALAALRTRDVQRARRVLLDVAALGVAAAADERTEPADPALELAPALGA